MDAWWLYMFNRAEENRIAGPESSNISTTAGDQAQMPAVFPCNPKGIAGATDAVN